MTGRRLGFALMTLAALALAAADDAFFEEIPDLPVMPVLSVDTEASAVFDTPAGRIVSVIATGDVARSAVLDYYGRALPQLGWRADGAARFRRESERLRIEFVDGADGLTVRFVLSPL